MTGLREGWLPEGTNLHGTYNDFVRKSAMLDPIAANADVYTLALERTAYVLDQHDRVCCAFSGGKDSTAVLNITLEVARSDPRFERHLPLRTYFFDEEAIPTETEAYVRRMSQRDDIALEWYCLPVKHRNACSRRSPYWWPWAPEDQTKWCRPMPPEAITAYPGFPVWPPEARMSIPDLNGLLCPPPHNTAMLMGIRAYESITRYRAVRRRKIDNYIVPYTGLTSNGNVWKAYPIYDWRDLDVWAAIRTRNWDYNTAYDLMEMAGVSPKEQRCSPAFGEEPLQKIHTYALCFPDVWARMAERVPGIGSAHRYARTELYAYRNKPAKPPGMPWPDFLTHYLNKYDPAEQQQIAERIRETITRHYRKTTHPILARTQHPDTGLTWHFLLSLAMRGDFKKRRTESQRLGGQDKRTLWHKYAQDLAQDLTDGTAADLAHPRPLPADPRTLIPAPYKEPPA